MAVTITGVIDVALFRNRPVRTALALTGALIALMVGFVWSSYMYSQQVARG